MNTETIQLGGINVDKDLAYMFNISIFDARIIKEIINPKKCYYLGW